MKGLLVLVEMKQNHFFFHIGYHLFLQYGWFLQNLGKDFIRSNMHTTVIRCQSYQIQSRGRGLSELGMHPQILADQSALYQPEGQIMPTTLLQAPSNFPTLLWPRTALQSRTGQNSWKKQGYPCNENSIPAMIAGQKCEHREILFS